MQIWSFACNPDTQSHMIIILLPWFQAESVVWAKCSCLCATRARHLNTLRPRQNGRHFADYIFKCILLNENVWIPIKNLLKFVPQGPINNIPTLVQIMAWCRSGDKPLSESMLVSLPTHICITRSQWVNDSGFYVIYNEYDPVEKYSTEISFHVQRSLQEIAIPYTFGQSSRDR